MSYKWKLALSCFMVLSIVVTLCVGCAEEEKEKKVTIVIGNLTDLTGAAAPALVPLQLALEAQVRHINEEDPIPGVELKILRYDSRYDPARAIPGYDWLRERGAEVIYTEMADMGEVLLPFAERDKVPVVCASVTEPLYKPPGWVFCINLDAKDLVVSIMEWISDNWDYDKDGKPQIGTAGWGMPYGYRVAEGAEYCQDHPDKYEYVGSYLAPAGTVTWSGEIRALKDCDYVVLTTPGAVQPSTFASEFRDKGYTAKFIGTDALAAFWGVMMGKVGSEDLDGTLIGQGWPWVQPDPIVDYMKELAYKYYSLDRADELIYSDASWVSGGIQEYIFIKCLQQAIEAVGAENFDGQAFYDTAINFSLTWEGAPDLGFTPTERRVSRWMQVYEYSHAEGDFIVHATWAEITEE